jgi:hypothetical protein
VEREASSQHSAAAGAATLERDAGAGEENGGFPEPPPGAVVRVVQAEHSACGHQTRVRLPVHVPPAAVRRVVCNGCATAFETPGAESVEVLASDPVAVESPAQAPAAAIEPAAAPRRRWPGRRRRRWRRRFARPRPTLPKAPSWLRDPGSRAWRLASIPIAAAAVIGGLLLIQGSGEEDSATPFASDAPGASAGGAKGEAKAGKARAGGNATLVREASFSLALPAGWERTPAADGATFAAAADGGDADATLWVEQDAGLSFSEFEARSLDTLEALAGSARVTERVTAPTPEETIARLAADNPPGAPAYAVTLRAAGPYRYYLATTVQPDASDEAAKGADLIHGSFQPTAADGGNG